MVYFFVKRNAYWPTGVTIKLTHFAFLVNQTDKALGNFHLQDFLSSQAKQFVVISVL